jgi:hypothetical protein
LRERENKAQDLAKLLIPKMGELNNISTFENVGRVRGHLRDSYVECVSFGDLIKDRKDT